MLADRMAAKLQRVIVFITRIRWCQTLSCFWLW